MMGKNGCLLQFTQALEKMVRMNCSRNCIRWILESIVVGCLEVIFTILRLLQRKRGEHRHPKGSENFQARLMIVNLWIWEPHAIIILRKSQFTMGEEEFMRD